MVLPVTQWSGWIISPLNSRSTGLYINNLYEQIGSDYTSRQMPSCCGCSNSNLKMMTWPFRMRAMSRFQRNNQGRRNGRPRCTVVIPHVQRLRPASMSATMHIGPRWSLADVQQNGRTRVQVRTGEKVGRAYLRLASHRVGWVKPTNRLLVGHFNLIQS